MDNSKILECKLCGGTFTIAQLLKRPEGYKQKLDVLLCSSPCCNSHEELQISDGLVKRGYVYAAGSAHFAAMENYEVTHLVVIGRSQVLEYEVAGMRLITPTITGVENAGHLSIEIGAKSNQVFIHGTPQKLRWLAGEITKIASAAEAHEESHLHFMSSDWGGKELSNTIVGNSGESAFLAQQLIIYGFRSNRSET